jgi:uncharacterized protein YcbX
MTLRLSGLHLYPVKSCSGLSPSEWAVERFGLRHDRRWMVVTPDGRALTQRELPFLALVRPTIAAPGLLLEAPGQPPHQTPLEPVGGRRRLVQVWGDRVEAWLPDPAADRWFTRYLGQEVCLAYFPEGALRPVDPDYAREGVVTAFADGFPFLLATTASLQDLNGRLREPLPMNRFRPNLVVSGSLPFAEDLWRRIRVGSLEFDVAKPCARCVITTTDQETAERGVEPLRTLATYRRKGEGVLFGQNLTHRGEGMLRVGDQVTVLSEVIAEC